MALSYRYKACTHTKTVLYVCTASSEHSAQVQHQQAERAGFVIDLRVEDLGLSAIGSALHEREGGKRLFEILREGDVLLVRWIDRLGRTYEDIQRNMRLFLQRGVTIKTVAHAMTFEARPKDPTDRAVQDAMLSLMSAIAQEQALANKEAQAAGIAHAKAQNPSAYKGRKPSYGLEHVDRIRQMSAEGLGVNEMARRLGLSKFLVSRINKDIPAAYAALQRWGIGIAPPAPQG